MIMWSAQLQTAVNRAPELFLGASSLPVKLSQLDHYTHFLKLKKKIDFVDLAPHLINSNHYGVI